VSANISLNERPLAQPQPIRHPSMNPASDATSINPNDRSAHAINTPMTAGFSTLDEVCGSTTLLKKYRAQERSYNERSSGQLV
jgi:hypothetical protein